MGTLSPGGAIQLGTELLDRGDTAEVLAAFKHAIDSGHVDGAAAGAWWSAHTLKTSGDLRGARAFYEQAIATNHDAWAPRAATDLGTLLEAEGDVVAARQSYEIAMTGFGDPSDADTLWPHRAAVKLEILLTEQGDVAGARAIYRRAIGFGDLAQRERFAFNRGHELRGQGNVAQAAASYQEVIDLRHTGAPAAAYVLGDMLESSADHEAARIVYQVAIDSGDPNVASQAASRLTLLETE